MVEVGDPGVLALVGEAFPSSPSAAWRPGSMTDANRGRGVFSTVVRVELEWTLGDGPRSVVVKMPAAGANGAVSIASGACRREAVAYRQLLPRSPVGAPACHLVRTDGDAASFVLEDLSEHRAVDQLDGLGADDALAVCRSLARFHRHWQDDAALDELAIRRSTPSSIDPAAIEPGLSALRDRWGHAAEPSILAAFERLVQNRQRLVDAFAAAGPVGLCHGDPRADNLVFDGDGAPVLFDWQQIAVQFGPADLAWLAATSLTPATRRTIERDLIDEYGTTIDHYRLGLVLPGLAVLLLAQRDTDDERSAAFVAASIHRIGTALADLDVPDAGLDG